MWSARISIPSLRAFSNGKGTSVECAVASAYAELAERLSVMDTGIKIGPYRQLYGEKGDLLSKVTMFKYMDGYKWTHQGNIKNPVGAEELLSKLNFSTDDIERIKLDSDLLRHWIPGKSLINNEERYVPILLSKWISATNGLASGNTIEEAISHGICEIFERFSLIRALRGINNIEFPTIDISTIESTWIRNSINHMNNSGIEVVVKDIGEDIYPVFAVATFNEKIKKGFTNFNKIKAGASFTSRIGVERCLTERMQGAFIEEEVGSSVRSTVNKDPYLPIFFKSDCDIDLSSLKNGPVRAFNNLIVDDPQQDLENAKKIVSAAGLDIIYIDHTHKYIDFPVVRVIIPGMSDFIDWWETNKNPDFIGNIDYKEDAYEQTLVKMLKTFANESIDTSYILQDKVRRDT